MILGNIYEEDKWILVKKKNNIAPGQNGWKSENPKFAGACCCIFSVQTDACQYIYTLNANIFCNKIHVIERIYF